MRAKADVPKRLTHARMILEQLDIANVTPEGVNVDASLPAAEVRE